MGEATRTLAAKRRFHTSSCAIDRHECSDSCATSTTTQEQPMNELIDAIRAAVTEGATPEQKAIGAQACRTILAALDAQPGKPIVLPGAVPVRPLSGVSLDQILDLAIARLTPIADARDGAPTASNASTAPNAAPVSVAPRVGLRVPVSGPPHRQGVPRSHGGTPGNRRRP
jgi:hypothetical protein